MITITLYKEERPDSLVAESTFTSELSTTSNNWKAFAKRNGVDEDLQIIQSDDFMLIAYDDIRMLDIKCDEYPYDITPIDFNNIRDFNNKHCCVLSKKNEYHYPVNTIYVISDLNSNNYSQFAYVFDNILFTYASFLNTIFSKCSLNGTEITITLPLNEQIFTMTPKYKNLLSLDYLPSISNAIDSTTYSNNSYKLTFDITKPSDNQVVVYIDDKKVTLTPSNEPVNIEKEDDILGNNESIAPIKTFINQIVQTADFKARYNNLIKTTNFEQLVRQFISNFPINNCTVTNAMIYTCSFIMNISISNVNSFYSVYSQNKDWIISSITNSDKSFMYAVQNFIDMFSNPRSRNMNGNILGFIVYYAANYIANNTCINVLDYLLNFINGIPDSINPIKYVSCDVTPFVVDVPTQNVTIKTPKISEGTSQPPKEDKNTEEESSNIIWIILAIVAVVVIVVIILFVSKKKTSNNVVQTSQ